MTSRHKLEDRLDSTAAGPLAGELRALAGADLVLDASGVTHLGTPGVQVLLSAAASWRTSGAVLASAVGGSGTSRPWADARRRQHRHPGRTGDLSP